MSFSVFLSVVGKYIGPLVIYMAIAAAIYIPCRLLYLKRKQRAFAVWHELFLFLFWVYAFGVFSQTVLPTFRRGPRRISCPLQRSGCFGKTGGIRWIGIRCRL